MPAVPRVLSQVVGWYSGRMVVAGVPLEGLMQADSEEERTRGKVWGQRKSGRPLGRTSGKYEAKPFVLKVLADEWHLFVMPVLTALGLGSYGSAEFPVSFTFFEPLNPQLTINNAWDAACVINMKDSLTEGPDPYALDITLDALSMKRNGQVLYDFSRDIL